MATGPLLGLTAFLLLHLAAAWIGPSRGTLDAPTVASSPSHTDSAAAGLQPRERAIRATPSVGSASTLRCSTSSVSSAPALVR